MTIQVGDRLPQATFRVMTAGRPGSQDHGRHLQGSQGGAGRGPRRLHAHLPPEPSAGLRAEADEIRAKGIDAIAVTAVNDVFVMEA